MEVDSDPLAAPEVEVAATKNGTPAAEESIGEEEDDDTEEAEAAVEGGLG